MLTRRATLFLILTAFLLPAYLFAQAESQPERANFSGRWRMVKEKSDFARATMPDMIVRVVDQRGITMNVHTLQTTGTKTATADVSYFTDGSASTNIINGHEAVSQTFWDGPALMVRTTIKLSNGENEMVLDRWELSDDGQTLTTTSRITTAKGGVDLKLVCVKEKTEG